MSTTTASAPLQEVAHAQVGELFDVATLLRAAGAALPVGVILADAEADHLRRLIRMAQDRVQAVVDAFTPHI